MKQVKIVKFGGPEVLEVTDGQALVPGVGQVLIEVESAGVGYVDVMARNGIYAPLSTIGFVPGIEVAGKVKATGEGVAKDLTGKTVFARISQGGYATHAIADESEIVVLPEGITTADAVATGVNALVAYFASKTVGKGDKVLVRGASGGIGMMAVQLTAIKGAIVTAITSSEKRGDLLQKLGATSILNRTIQAEQTNTTYDVIIDTVAGSEMGSYVGKLSPNGRYILCGGIAGMPDKENIITTMLENYHYSPSLSFFSLNSIAPQVWRPACDEIFQLIGKGQLQPVIGETFALSAVQAAHEKLEKGDVLGKIILVP